MNKKKESKVVPNVRFKGFTDDWKQRKLGEITDVRDGTHDSPKYVQEGHPFITSKNVSNGFINYDDVQYVTDADYEEINKRSKVDVHDILMGMIGTIGNLALIRKEPDFAIKNVALIKYTGDVDYQYLYQALQAGCVTNQLSTGMDGGTQKFVSLKKIRELDIPFPDGWEQRKIGAYFSTIDHLITLHQQKITLLIKLKKAMLEKMFPKKGSVIPEIRFNGFANAWEQRKVLDLLIQPITDGPHETPKLVEEGVPFISVDAIVDNEIDFNRKRGNISEEYDELCCKKYKPQFHDVYLVKSGSTVGKVAIVETTDRFNIWSPLAAMRCGEKTYPYFLYDLLQTKDLQAQVADKASNGTQPNLSMRELEKFPVSVPSNLEEQKKIGDYFRNLDHLITLYPVSYTHLTLPTIA